MISGIHKVVMLDGGLITIRRKKLRTYPAGHIPAVVVPDEGARCTTCIYFRDDGHAHCVNRHYERWAGTRYLVDPVTNHEVTPDRFCTDWYDSGMRN